MAITEIAEDAAAARTLTLVETPTPLTSSNGTPGLVVADTVAYLKSWDVIRPNPNEADQGALFNSAVGQLRAEKLKTLREVLQSMKKVTAITP